MLTDLWYWAFWMAVAMVPFWSPHAATIWAATIQISWFALQKMEGGFSSGKIMAGKSPRIPYKVNLQNFPKKQLQALFLAEQDANGKASANRSVLPRLARLGVWKSHLQRYDPWLLKSSDSLAQDSKTYGDGLEHGPAAQPPHPSRPISFRAGTLRSSVSNSWSFASRNVRMEAFERHQRHQRRISHWQAVAQQIYAKWIKINQTTWDLRPSGIENACLLLIWFLLGHMPRAMMCLFNQIQYDWIQPPKMGVMMIIFISHHCSSIWFLIAIMALQGSLLLEPFGSGGFGKGREIPVVLWWFFYQHPGFGSRLIWGGFRSRDPRGSFGTPAAMWKGLPGPFFEGRLTWAFENWVCWKKRNTSIGWITMFGPVNIGTITTLNSGLSYYKDIIKIIQVPFV